MDRAYGPKTVGASGRYCRDERLSVFKARHVCEALGKREAQAPHPDQPAMGQPVWIVYCS